MGDPFGVAEPHRVHRQAECVPGYPAQIASTSLPLPLRPPRPERYREIPDDSDDLGMARRKPPEIGSPRKHPGPLIIILCLNPE